MVLLGAVAIRGQAIKDPSLPNPMQVSIRLLMLASVEKASFKVGEPVLVNSRLKSVSSIMARVVSSRFQVVVTDAAGRELQRTKYGKDMLTMFDFSPRVDEIAPGAEQGGASWDLRMVYEVTQPGRYFVRMMHTLGSADLNDPRRGTNDQKVADQIPIEVAISDLIPFTITP